MDKVWVTVTEFDVSIASSRRERQVRPIRRIFVAKNKTYRDIIIINCFSVRFVVREKPDDGSCHQHFESTFNSSPRRVHPCENVDSSRHIFFLFKFFPHFKMAPKYVNVDDVISAKKKSFHHNLMIYTAMSFLHPTYQHTHQILIYPSTRVSKKGYL